MSDQKTMAQELAESSSKPKTREEIRDDLLDKFPKLAICGKIDLFEPIISKDVPVNVLHYDYGKLTSEELVVALDGDPKAVNLRGRISNRQATLMFALACGKVERPISGLDTQDIIERLSSRDVITAITVSKNFFTHVFNVTALSISET